MITSKSLTWWGLSVLREKVQGRAAQRNGARLSIWGKPFAPSSSTCALRSFNPPNWVFAPVWTTLYVLMAFAVWRILRLPQVSAARRLTLSLFFIQLALNAAWSWMFFGANNPLFGLINIVPQFLAILATVVAFHRLDRMAAWCLLPLLAWVAFASVLNVAIW